MISVVRVAFDPEPSNAMQWRTDAPIPHVEPNSAQVRVKIVAASANPADSKLNSGLMPILRFMIGKGVGSDVAGVVDEVGDKVTEFRVGDRVFGCTGMMISGAFSEYVVGSETLFARIPEHLSFVEAAAVPLASTTALDISKLVDSGQTVAVRGASGGIGCALVQLLVARGARVIAITSRPDLVRGLGAHEVIERTNWELRLAGRALDVFVDLVGGDECWFSSRAVLKPNGRFITAAGNFGDGLTVPLIVRLIGAALWRFVAFRVSSAPSYELVFSSESKAKMDELAQLLSAKTLRPVLDPASPLPFTFENVKLAMDRIAKSNVAGKLVIRIAPEN